MDLGVDEDHRELQPCEVAFVCATNWLIRKRFRPLWIDRAVFVSSTSRVCRRSGRRVRSLSKSEVRRAGSKKARKLLLLQLKPILL